MANVLDLIKLNKKKAQQLQQRQTPPKEENPPVTLAKGMLNIKDVISPSAIEIDFNHIKIGNTYYRTLFITGYPRFVGANWLSPIINFEHTLDISMFYYPIRSKGVLDDLRRKITELEATVKSATEKGKLADPAIALALDDAKSLQEQLVKGAEKFFQFSFYITIPAETIEELENVSRRIEATLGSMLLISRTASLVMEEAFQSTIPTASDKLLVVRNMDTTSLATTFPFTSSDLTMEDGIMYGINMHNGSLIIFDRFSMENANTVVFAKSGSGKSYFVKLEALRSLVFGTQVIIIDPEDEYRPLAEAVGGDYINFSVSSPVRVNPFDLSGVATEGENELGQKILSLHALFKIMLGNLTSTEEAILDRAIIEAYRIKGITTDPETQMKNEPPIMEDLYKVLLGFIEPEARSMADRIERFIRGSLAGIFDSQSNMNLKSNMIVFSTKNLEDILRPIAFFIILDFVWTQVRRELRRRILIVEEAWYMLQNEDSAKFIYGIAKRARKYYLGLTTITQDVADFLGSDYGKAIVTNSSIQMLLKQHPAGIDLLADTFYLSEGEKRLLLAADKGQGLFFAGPNHVAIRVEASAEEHALITTNPEEILKMRMEREKLGRKQPSTGPDGYKQAEIIDINKYEELSKTAPQTPFQKEKETEQAILNTLKANHLVRNEEKPIQNMNANMIRPAVDSNPQAPASAQTQPQVQTQDQGQALRQFQTQPNVIPTSWREQLKQELPQTPKEESVAEIGKEKTQTISSQEGINLGDTGQQNQPINLDLQ